MAQRDVVINWQELFDYLVQHKNTKCHLSEVEHLFPEALNRQEDIITWFKQHSDKFVVFQNDEGTSHYVAARVKAIKLCQNFQRGVCTKQTCQNLHLCREFVAGACSRGIGCPLNHSFQEATNQRILTQANVSKFTDEEVKKILQVSILQVCGEYNINAGACPYGDRCIRLHLCKNYAKGRCDRGRDCLLNHTFTSGHSQRLLESYGLLDQDHDEVLAQLLIGRGRRIQHRGVRRDRFRALALDTLLVPLAQAALREAVDESDDEDDADEDQEAADAGTSKSPLHATAAAPPRAYHPPTIHFHQDDGVTEICVEYMAHRCQEGKDCRLHHWVENNFVWQVKIFERWESFDYGVMKKIEEAYCDVSNSEYSAHMPAEVLGTADYPILINFETMSGSAELFGELDIYAIRRLATPSVSRAEVGDSKGRYVQYLWYWKTGPAHNDWMPFDDESQAALEDAFLKKEGCVNYLSKYTVNFNSMEQVNLTTGRPRKVKRRPLYQN